MRNIFLASVAMLAIFFCACSSDNGGNEENIIVPTGCELKLQGDYYLAGLLPYTGPWPVGQGWEDAILLAASEINAQGGIKGGKTIGVITCNSEGNKETAVLLTSALAATVNLAAVVGPGRSAEYLGTDVNDMGACKTAAAAKMVTISPGATNPTIGDIADDGFCFRTCAHDGVQGAVWAQLVKSKSFTKAHYINPDDDSYSMGLASEFKKAAEALNITVTGDSFNRTSDPNYVTTTLENAKTNAAEVVMLSMLLDDGVEFVNKWAIMNWTANNPPFLIGPDGMAVAAFLTQVTDTSKLVGKMYISYPGYPNESYKTFAQNFKARYNKDPAASEFQASAYDAFYLLAIAMEVSADPVNKEQIKTGLAKTQPGVGVSKSTVADWSGILSILAEKGQVDYAGAGGDQDFDAKGDVVQPIGVYIIEGGAFKDAPDPCWTLAGKCN